MFKEILWLIRDENHRETRRSMIKTYVRVCRFFDQLENKLNNVTNDFL